MSHWECNILDYFSQVMPPVAFFRKTSYTREEMAYLCPACQSEMDVSATACQICLRPRSRQEILRDLQKDRRKVETKRRFKLGFAFALALGAGAYVHRDRWPELKRRLAPVAAPAVES